MGCGVARHQLPTADERASGSHKAAFGGDTVREAGGDTAAPPNGASWPLPPPTSSSPSTAAGAPNAKSGGAGSSAAGSKVGRTSSGSKLVEALPKSASPIAAPAGANSDNWIAVVSTAAATPAPRETPLGGAGAANASSTASPPPSTLASTAASSSSAASAGEGSAPPGVVPCSPLPKRSIEERLDNYRNQKGQRMAKRSRDSSKLSKRNKLSASSRQVFLSNVPEVEADIPFRFAFVVIGPAAESVIEAACDSSAAKSLEKGAVGVPPTLAEVMNSSEREDAVEVHFNSYSAMSPSPINSPCPSPMPPAAEASLSPPQMQLPPPQAAASSSTPGIAEDTSAHGSARGAAGSTGSAAISAALSALSLNTGGGTGGVGGTVTPRQRNRIGSGPRISASVTKSWRCLCPVGSRDRSSRMSSEQTEDEEEDEGPRLAKLMFTPLNFNEDLPPISSRGEAVSSVFVYALWVDDPSSCGGDWPPFAEQLEALDKAVQVLRRRTKAKLRPVRALLLVQRPHAHRSNGEPPVGRADSSASRVGNDRWAEDLADFEKNHGYLWKFGPVRSDQGNNVYAAFAEMAASRATAAQEALGEGQEKEQEVEECEEDETEEAAEDFGPPITGRVPSDASFTSNASEISEGWQHPPNFDAEESGSEVGDHALDLHLLRSGPGPTFCRTPSIQSTGSVFSQPPPQYGSERSGSEVGESALDYHNWAIANGHSSASAGSNSGGVAAAAGPLAALLGSEGSPRVVGTPGANTGSNGSGGQESPFQTEQSASSFSIPMYQTDASDASTAALASQANLSLQLAQQQGVSRGGLLSPGWGSNQFGFRTEQSGSSVSTTALEHHIATVLSMGGGSVISVPSGTSAALPGGAVAAGAAVGATAPTAPSDAPPPPPPPDPPAPAAEGGPSSGDAPPS